MRVLWASLALVAGCAAASDYQEQANAHRMMALRYQASGFPARAQLERTRAAELQRKADDHAFVERKAAWFWYNDTPVR